MNTREDSRMLVIDDDDNFRHRLCRAFSDRGYEVDGARNVGEVIEYLTLHKPDLVVLDLKLAEESGLNLLRDHLGQDRSIKVVVLTGYGSIATAVEAMKLGAVNYLTKPVDADRILEAFGVGASNFKPQAVTTEAPLAQVEWEHIQRVLLDCDGNVTQAARQLGLHRRSLQRKLQKAPARLR